MKKRHAKKKIHFLLMIHNNSNVSFVLNKFCNGKYWAIAQYASELEQAGFWESLGEKMQLTWKGVRWLRKLGIKNVNHRSTDRAENPTAEPHTR